jgi:hypothetical protein
MARTRKRPLTVEVGRVYRTANYKYFLAIDTNKLISAYNAEVVHRRATPALILVAQISVEQLWGIWKITEEQMDEISRKHLYPDLVKDPTRPDKMGRRGQGRSRAPFVPTIYRLADLSS